MGAAAYSFLVPPGVNFVNNGAVMTVATLLGTFAASSALLGLYARVSDLWGATDEVMRCSTDGTNYFWRPQRTDYAVNNAATGGSITLTPLVSAPTQFMTATTTTSNMTITPSATNAWPGAQFTVVQKGLVGALLSINIAGLVGGSSLPLLTGNSRTLLYTSSGWQGS